MQGQIDPLFYPARLAQHLIPMTQFIAADQSPSGGAGSILGQRWIAQRSFARNVAILGGGTALAQTFNILLAPVLTRLYSPDSFGRYALFVSFLNVAMVGVSLRYEPGILAARAERKAAQLAFAAFLFSLPTSL